MRVRFHRSFALRPAFRHAARHALLVRLVLGASTACIPYTVGSTPETAPVGELTHTSSYYFIPNAVKSPGDTVASPLAGADFEWRQGLDDRSDAGVRLMPGAGGVIVNYKHRFVDAGPGQPALAYMLGGGVVNWGEHAEMEATLLASGSESSRVMPFGGLRAIKVLPITQGAVSDSPTLGGFGGVQIGDRAFSIRPEIGVNYDHSALNLRRSNIIVVPAVSLARGPRRDNADARANAARRPPRTEPTRDGSICRLLGLGSCRT